MEHLADLIKAEDPESYRKMAEKGIMVAHPVKISGKDRRDDNGIHYHSTVKYFNPDKDHPHEIHNIAKELTMNPPNPKTTGIEPGMFKDRFGNDVYVIKMKGNDADRIKEHNSRFSHMGYPATFDYTPHVSVDKATHDRIKASGAKTAHEAGIEFGNAQLHHGPNVLATYRHPMIDNTPIEQHDPIVPITEKDHKKLAASEKETGTPLQKPYVSEAQRRWAHTESGKKALGGESGVHEWDEATKGKKIPERVQKTSKLEKVYPIGSDSLEKSALKHAVTGAAMLGASLAHSPSAAAPMHSEKPFYDHKTMLDTISDVESSGGQNTNHSAVGSGINRGSHAFGKYGLTPSLVKETIRMNPEMRTAHSKALALEGDTVNKYLQDNPGLEDKIADRHLSRLEHHFGNDPVSIGYSWLNGITGTNAAKNKGEDISGHWHVKKVKDAYTKRRGQ